jgi:uncharacterized protein (TIGR00251 family)
MGSFYRIDAQGDLLLTIRVQQRSSVDRIDGPAGPALKIRITAPPVEGKANQHLMHFLAKALALRPAQVTIEAGESARTKRLRISGLTAEARSALIARLSTPLAPSSQPKE